jgi:uncharacterized protein YcaQ
MVRSLPLVHLPNRLARRVFLLRHGLSDSTPGTAAADLVRRIGFVQVDSIATVERAHHMILWSRDQSYRPEALKAPLEQDRHLWEHWTHDAAILPVETYPYWKHRFHRDATRLQGSWQRWFREGYEAQFERILNHIAAHGPVTSSDVSTNEPRGTGGWWDWHPSKTALEWLWRTGQLAISRRERFHKVYDLTERVIPAALLQAEVTAEDMTAWACNSALDHLGFGSVAEIAAFWEAIPRDAARAWTQAALAKGEIVEIAVEGADGSQRAAFARPDILAIAEAAPTPPARLRVLSPFDPALRDRARAEFLFGFHYRIEVFVPEPKRRWGYYVFPVLEGDRLTGRLDAKAHRAEGTLRVRAFWPEAGVQLTKARTAKLMAELDRLARFSGCNQVELSPGWQRDFLPPKP